MCESTRWCVVSGCRNAAYHQSRYCYHHRERAPMRKAASPRHEPLDTVIEAIRAGDFELVKLHREYLVGWLEELKRQRERPASTPPPCPRCNGGGTWVAPDDTTRPCPECHGEKIRRASSR